MDMVRTMMVEAYIEISYLGDVLLTTIYILNREPSKSVETTPYESYGSVKDYN